MQTQTKLTVDQIQTIYAKAWDKALLKRGDASFWNATAVCQRILNWKYSRIISSHTSL